MYNTKTLQMPELEEKKDQQVTYARFDTTDADTADFNSKINRYVWENLPLTPEQKCEFRNLFLADTDGDGNGVCHSSVDEDG
jgi:hypothetical protein